jgi:Xaa-Pro aminopeptidase
MNFSKALCALLFISTPLSAQIPDSEYAARRAALAQRVGNGVVVALGSPEPEEDFLSFNQNSNFRYLTNFNEPNAALVMVVKNGAIAGSPLLFVEPSDPAREVWTGHRLGIPAVRTTLGMEGRDFATLKDHCRFSYDSERRHRALRSR